ncbi:protein Gemin2 [Scaptodrosophila lebanonensis]|uniref:Gem-associated protein 2 n=1 Tax=Drosophila lebanonensis TaxID=7225 RepID=A0A6J2UFQ9_DROLE|nr:protein Gemin2 [Scaptodrosophila lebanonensis]
MQCEPEESQSFQMQALEIPDLGKDFDPKKPPVNGEEYLMHMLYERKRCPVVVTKRSDKITNESAASSCSGIQGTPSPPPSPMKCLFPTPEWQQTQSSSFKEARSRISAIRRELKVHKYDESIEPPLTTDIEQWLHFCRDQEPLLSTLLRLSQSDLELLLEMQSHWLKNDPQKNTEPSTSASTSIALHGSDAWLARWLYATLATLHMPLEPNVYSTLRSVARACLELRNQLQPEEEHYATPYNLIITIIVNVFGQADLAAYL